MSEHSDQSQKNVAHLDSHICKQSSISQMAMGFLQVFDVRDMPNSKNIAYTSVHLQFHMDSMYYEAPPGILLLHSIQ